MKFKSYQVLECIDPNWYFDGTQWTFPHKVVAEFAALADAQQRHKELTLDENFPMIEGCHKYVIIGVPEVI